MDSEFSIDIREDCSFFQNIAVDRQRIPKTTHTIYKQTEYLRPANKTSPVRNRNDATMDDSNVVTGPPLKYGGTNIGATELP